MGPNPERNSETKKKLSLAQDCIDTSAAIYKWLEGYSGWFGGGIAQQTLAAEYDTKFRSKVLYLASRLMNETELPGPALQQLRVHVLDISSAKLVAEALGFAGHQLEGQGAAPMAAVESVPRRGQKTYPDLDVIIEHEDWDNFQYKARILDVRLRVKNQTDKRKRLTGWVLTTEAGSGHDIEVVREVERRRRNHPELPGMIDPWGEVAGWQVYPFGWSVTPGTPQYTLTVIDELNFEYEGRRT